MEEILNKLAKYIFNPNTAKQYINKCYYLAYNSNKCCFILMTARTDADAIKTKECSKDNLYIILYRFRTKPKYYEILDLIWNN